MDEGEVSKAAAVELNNLFQMSAEILKNLGFADRNSWLYERSGSNENEILKPRKPSVRIMI